MPVIRSECSGCAEPFRLSPERMVVTMRVPSNGRRGDLHVPAHNVTAEVSIPDGSPLLEWECPFPGCGYAESYEEGL